MDRVRHARCVHEEAPAGPEDEPFAEDLSLLVAWHKLIAQLLENDHVPVSDGKDEAKINGVSVPLSSLILREDRPEEVILAGCSVGESESLKDRWMSLLEACLGQAMDNLYVPFCVSFGPQLAHLCFIQINNTALCHLKSSINFEVILVHQSAVKIIKILPVLNAGDFMVR